MMVVVIVAIRDPHLLLFMLMMVYAYM